MNARFFFLVLITSVVSVGPVRSQEYASADAAYKVALKHLKSRQFAKGQDALNASLKLNPDAGLKGRIYRTYLSPDAQPVSFEKTLEANEFILEHPISPAERAIYCSRLPSYLRATGKIHDGIEYFEKKLAANPNDFVSLYVLAEFHHHLQPNPERMIQVSEKLIASKKKWEDNEDVRLSAALAMNYVNAKRFADGATLYEKIAPLDSTTTAWYFKEAALAWFKADDKTRARAAAIASSTCKIPERRADALTYYWHRHLGELFAKMGDYGSATEHLEKAITSSNSDGSRRDCQALLMEVKEKLAR